MRALLSRRRQRGLLAEEARHRAQQIVAAQAVSVKAFADPDLEVEMRTALRES